MDENLTQAQGIIEDIEGTESRPGYSLIVYEVKGNSPKLFQVLQPGELFRPPLARPWAKFRACRVSAQRSLRLDHTIEVKSGDQLHSFELEIDFSYTIRMPELLAEHLGRDPLRQIRDEVERLTRDSVRGLTWAAIKSGSDELRSVLNTTLSIAGNQRPPIEAMRECALDFGIAILEVTLNRVLPEGELVKELADQAAEEERDRFVIDLEKQRQRTVLKARSTLDELTDAFQGMISRAGQGVDNVSDMQRTLHEFGKTLHQLSGVMSPLAPENSGAEPPVGSTHLLTGGNPTGDDALSRLMTEVCGHMSRVEAGARHRLSSQLLHLIAGVLDKDATDDEIDRYRDRIVDALDPDLEDLHLDRPQTSLLRRLTNIEELRQELRGRA